MMTVFLTVLSGVLVFVLGQLLLVLLIHPLQEFKRTIADIALAMTECAHVYGNPGFAGPGTEKEVSRQLRNLSARLNAQMFLSPFYDRTRRVFGLPSREAVMGAQVHLIGLSNGLFGDATDPDRGLRNAQKADEICDLLGIHIPDKWRFKKKA